MSTEAKLYGLGELNRQLEELAAGFKAGGNFGHVGRPGQVGGSAPGHVSVNTVRPRPYEGDKTRFLPDNGQKVPDKYTERHARFVGDVNESESMRFIATKEGNIFWLPEIANNVDHHQISAYHELDWLKEGEGFNGFLCSKKGLSDGDPNNWCLVSARYSISSEINLGEIENQARKEFPQWRKETLDRMRADEKRALSPLEQLSAELAQLTAEIKEATTFGMPEGLTGGRGGKHPHAGRPGMVGGSAAGSGRTNKPITPGQRVSLGVANMRENVYGMENYHGIKALSFDNTKNKEVAKQNAQDIIKTLEKVPEEFTKGLNALYVTGGGGFLGSATYIPVSKKPGYVSDEIMLMEGWLNKPSKERQLSLLHEIGHRIHETVRKDWLVEFKSLGLDRHFFELTDPKYAPNYKKSHYAGETFAQSFAQYLTNTDQSDELNKFWEKRLPR